MKILIVDDSRVMRQIIIRTLRHAGYDGHDILQAEGGRQALALAGAEQPDLVLSDWHMPDMSGIDCLRLLRSEGNMVPFGFITSDVSGELWHEALAAGATFLIGKPFSAETLREALEMQDPPVASGPGAHEDAAFVNAPVRPSGNPVPIAKDVRDLLAELLDRPVTVSAGRRVYPTRDAPVSLATYVDPGGTLTGLCLMDVPLSAYAAGALSLMPASGMVAEAVREQEFSPPLVEALHELANILSKVLNPPRSRRARLQKLYPPGAHVAEELLVSASGFERLDLAVDIPGYGKGAMSLVRTA